MKNTGTTGTNAVDWEARVDFDRLRDRAAGPAQGRARPLATWARCWRSTSRTSAT